MEYKSKFKALYHHKQVKYLTVFLSSCLYVTLLRDSNVKGSQRESGESRYVNRIQVSQMKSGDFRG